MNRTCAVPAVVLVTVFAVSVPAAERHEADLLPTSAGDLKITFLGHASLLFTFGGQHIYVDPYSKMADYSQLPKADLVLITHEHQDHLDPAALSHIRTARTAVVLPDVAGKQVSGGIVLRNGDVRTVSGLPLEAVPAYNLVHLRDNGLPFHTRGLGNGYILTFGDTRVYVAGDTEDIPEMRALKRIDWAFLPMNLPYTMTPEMVAEAAKAFRPKILYPYHFGTTDTSKLTALLRGQSGIEVRIRRLP